MRLRAHVQLNRPRRGQRSGAVLGAMLALALVGPGARAQCQPVWSTVQGGVFGQYNPADAGVLGLATSDPDGAGPAAVALHAGGGFSYGGFVPARRVARWGGWSWAPLGSGISASTDLVEAVAATGDGYAGSVPSPGVYYGGTFHSAGGAPAENIAGWINEEWRGLGAGTPVSVWAIGVHDADGPGALGSAVFAGPAFGSATASPGIARWDGVAWGPVGSGLGPYSPGQQVHALAFTVFDDDGPGPRDSALYVGGSFYYAGGLIAPNLARWDGSNWAPLSTTVYPGGDSVKALAVFDEDGDGPGLPALFAGGGFTMSGGGNLRRIARWNGQEWSGVGGGVGTGSVDALCVFDEDGDGPGRPCLFAGGSIGSAGGQTVAKIAKWDGQQWHSVGGGVSGWGGLTWIYAMAAFDEDGPGPNPGGLYVGGFFKYAGGVQSNAIARWGCPLAPQCYPNCNGDTTATGAARLDVSDYICFQTKFALNHAYADCDQNQVLDINDYICFQTRFALGCP